MSASWFRRHVKDSISTAFTLNVLIKCCMYEEHSAFFVGSKKQVSNLALMSQPRITLDSDRQPYSFISFKEMKSSGGMGSSEDAGRPKRHRHRMDTPMMCLLDKDRGLKLIRLSAQTSILECGCRGATTSTGRD